MKLQAYKREKHINWSERMALSLCSLGRSRI